MLGSPARDDFLAHSAEMDRVLALARAYARGAFGREKGAFTGAVERRCGTWTATRRYRA